MSIEKRSSSHNIDEIKSSVLKQNNDRPVWKRHNTRHFLEDYIREEFQELNDEFDPSKTELCRWNIASEIGDVEYLCIKYEDFIKPEPLPPELMFFRSTVWQLATQMGLNVVDCVHLKIVRNDLKYPASICNMYSYEEGREKCKRLWTLMGGDKVFYKWYEEIFQAL